MHPMTAQLIQSVDFLYTVEKDYSEMRRADQAFLVMVEWRKRLRYQRIDACAGEMANNLKEADINKHIMCRVRIEAIRSN